MIFVDENNDCNPSDDNEDLELELSDTESIPPLIYDSSDDDDDCDDDLISLSGGSDLSDLPGLASCGESDTESLDSDSEFDGDDSDDHDDDLSFSGRWLSLSIHRLTSYNQPLQHSNFQVEEEAPCSQRK